MNQFRKQTDGSIVNEYELRALFPNTSLPQQLTADILQSLGFDVLLEGVQVEGGTVYQSSRRFGEENIGGKWFTKYVLAPVFTDPIEEAAYKAVKDSVQSNLVKTSRDILLLKSDWSQSQDAKVDKILWATYRQSLRDISAQVGFPWNIIWPEEPATSAPLVPQSVTRRQARQALYNAGQLESVVTALNGIADVAARNLAIIEWEDSQVFERNRPLVILIGTSLGMDSNQLDALFIAASQL